MMIKTTDLLSVVSSQILGDGSLSASGFMRISHGQKWLSYLAWKQWILRSLGAAVSEIKTIFETTNVGSQYKCTVGFYPPQDMLSFANPTDLVYKLDALGLLLWWLDDGCLIVHEKRNGVSISRFGYLCTEQFDELINQQLSVALLNRFGLISKVHVDKGGIKGQHMVYYRLYFSATEMRKLIDIVRPWISLIPQEMLYKLNMDYRPNRLKSSGEFAELYNF